MRFLLPSVVTLLIFAAPLLAAETADNVPNDQAIDDVKAGRRTDANAAWWGFDEEDATDAVQAAIDSGAATVTIPNLGQDWIVRPLRLAGNQELILEQGVVIVAKRGEYRGRRDSVFAAQDVDNLIIRSEGATVRMQKEDYIAGLVLTETGSNRWFGQYEKSEARMCLALRGCSNVRVEGLKLADSGGDGIYIDGSRKAPCCTGIHIKNVTCDNNYRQGISVISVDGLRIEDSSFCNTWGTPPSAGIDIEPDEAANRVSDITIRHCRFEDNHGAGIQLHFPRLTAESTPVSILFQDCRVTSSRGAGIRISKLWDNGPQGGITFQNCTVEHTEAYGIKVQDKSANAARVRFVDCPLSNTANNRNYADTWAPVVLLGRADSKAQRYGGIEFTNCRVEDDRDRPFLSLPAVAEVFDVMGEIAVKNRHAAGIAIGETPRGWSLSVKPATE
jgi:polygalacturonase